MATIKNRTKLIALSLAAVGVIAIGGISAYFTDVDHAPNVFTVGSGVDIRVDEPGWDPEDDTHNDIVPNQVFTKDPQVVNQGDISAYAFMTVSVPYENVKTANADGTVNDAADTELFSYDVNTGWSQVGTGVKDTTAKTVTYTYAYATDDVCTELAKNQTTPAVFDEVQFADVAEGEIQGKTLTIDVKGYAIQSASLENGVTAPAAVWSLLSNQVAD